MNLAFNLSVLSLFRLVILPENIFDWKNNQVFFSAETQGTCFVQQLQEEKKYSIRNLALEFAGESSLSVLRRKVLIYFTGIKKA